MNIPRGPIYRDEREQADTPDKYATAMLKWREDIRTEAMATMKQSLESGNVGDYVRAICGQHWKTARPKYKSHFVDNRIGKARYDKLALLTDTRPKIDVTSVVEEMDSTAKMIEGVIAAEWLANDMDLSLILAADIAYAHGTAFWKLGAAAPGHMRVLPCGPENVMPIQPGFNLQDSTAVYYRVWKSINWLVSKFGRERCAGIEREVGAIENSNGVTYERPSHIDQYTWDPMSPGMKRVIGKATAGPAMTDLNLFGSIDYQEIYVDDLSINESRNKVLMKDPNLPTDAHNWWYWVEPGQRLYPRKRLAVFAGRRLMYDGPSPYFHGQYPFSVLRFNPVFWSFWGLSKYRDLIAVNQAMNEIIAGILDMIKKHLNPVAVTREGPYGVPPQAWKEFFPDRPGAKLRMGPMANPEKDIKWMESPQLPSYIFQVLTQFLVPEFDRMSDLLDMTQMAGKNQVPGGDTIEMMRDSHQTGIKLEERLMEVFLRDAGQQAVSNVIQFYNVKKRIHMLGEKGVVPSDFDWDPGVVWPSGGMKNEDPTRFNHWQKFPFNITPGSLHGGARDRSKQVAIVLRQMKDISREELWRRMEIGNPGQIKKELNSEIQDIISAQQAAAPQQQPTPADIKSHAEGIGAGVVQQLMDLAQHGQPPEVGDMAGDSGVSRLSRGARNGQGF